MNASAVVSAGNGIGGEIDITIDYIIIERENNPSQAHTHIYTHTHADIYTYTTARFVGRLPMRGLPLCFHHVEGECVRDGDRLSFFNMYEAALLTELIRDLIKGK